MFSLSLLSVEAPVVTVESSAVTPTSIPVRWTSGGSEGLSYEVVWSYEGGCADISGGSDSISGDMTNYTVEGLEEYITYSITVTATNSESSEVSQPVSGLTTEAGEYIVKTRLLICDEYSVSVAPTDPPTPVSASSSSTSITVQWGPVDCIHRNGDITGYSVQYGEVGSESTHTVNETSKTISGLSTSTNYTYQVAARNSAGLGPYSDLQTIPTDSKL